MVATLSRDRSTGRLWLEFPSKPDATTIAALKAAGWRWGGYRKAWHNPSRFAKVPDGIAYDDGGEVDYAAERADRLEERASKAQTRAGAAFGTAHRIADGIPLGQPILVGHHSERRARRDADRIHSAMSKGCAEARKADRLEQAARGSAHAAAHREDPGAIARRIERLKKDRAPLFRWTTELEERARRLAICNRDIAAAEAALAAAGGLPADNLDPKPGDVVRIKGWTVRVRRVNPRTISGTIIGETPGSGADGHEGKWDKSHLRAIVKRAAEAA